MNSNGNAAAWPHVGSWMAAGLVTCWLGACGGGGGGEESDLAPLTAVSPAVETAPVVSANPPAQPTCGGTPMRGMPVLCP